MDGIRFASVLSIIGCSLAEMTWTVGVDALSFGTKKMLLWVRKRHFILVRMMIKVLYTAL